MSRKIVPYERHCPFNLPPIGHNNSPEPIFEQVHFEPPWAAALVDCILNSIIRPCVINIGGLVDYLRWLQLLKTWCLLSSSNGRWYAQHDEHPSWRWRVDYQHHLICKICLVSSLYFLAVFLLLWNSGRVDGVHARVWNDNTLAGG